MAFLATLCAFCFALLGLSMGRILKRPGRDCRGCGGCPDFAGLRAVGEAKLRGDPPARSRGTSRGATRPE